MTARSFRSIGIAAFAAGIALVAPGAAGAQSTEKAASVSGIWNMSLIGDHVIPVALVLEQSGTALKGTFTLMGKDFPLTGEYAGGKLTLTGQGPAFGRPQVSDHDTAVAATGGGTTPKTATVQIGSFNMALADMTISGVTNPDGGLGGTIAMKFGEGTGTIKWTAERFKERKLPEAQSTEGVSVTGSWKMTIPEAGQLLDVEFTQDGSKITGTATNEHLGTLNLAGTLTAGTLSFVATGSAMGQQVKIEFAGKYTKAGTFAGDAQSPMGAMTWTAERVKK